MRLLRSVMFPIYLVLVIMCVNTRPIYNRFIRQLIQVDCGKCPACQQKKAAARSSRIRNNVTNGYVPLFVTLTYDNKYVPYVFRSDLDNNLDYVKVHRNFKFRHVRVDSSYDFEGCSFYYPHVLDSVLMQYDIPNKARLMDLKKMSGRVGVCYYPDVQLFFKRFRQYLIRDFNIHDTFNYFACSEYGPSTNRPHFHLLIYVPASKESSFRSAIIKAWPYADRCRTEQYIEVARDAAGYVSSYVNSGNFIPKVLSDNFNQKHSYSKTFGMGLECFSLEKILEKVSEGDLRYNVKRTVNGTPDICSVPIPKYVINRYFPRFKGYSRLTDSEVCKYILSPERLFEKRCELDYTDSDLYNIKVSLDNAFNRYNSRIGKNRFDFACDFVSSWRCYRSTCIRNLHDGVADLTDYLQFYDNNNELVNGVVHSFNLVETFRSLDGFVENPNSFRYRVKETMMFEDLYNRKCKQKVVTNSVMSAIGHDV